MNSNGEKLNINAMAEGLLAGLGKREREIIEGRYGLNGGTEMTLAALGKRYHITRERIRQIQNLTLATFRGKAKENKLAEFASVLSAHLSGFGGVRRDDMLVGDAARMAGVSNVDARFAASVRFLLEASEAAEYRPADKEYHAFWCVTPQAEKSVATFIGSLVKNLSAKKRAVLEDKKFTEVFAETVKAHGLHDSISANFAAISKKFATNHYGDEGLAAWSEVNPRTSRDYAYLVLKKEAKPLHFTTIAERINAVRKRKKTNYQTVHNELIKDERFVLVGRGTYGLGEFGLIAGTAKEVMTGFLKKHGPMTSKEVIRMVLEKRVFKENTLLLNLQNRKHFTRLGDGKYTVKEV